MTPHSITRIFAAEPWSAIVNAAAYTDVDGAESDASLAFAVNAVAPSRLAAEAAGRGIPLIHISTDYVFDGRKGVPYVEDDATSPLNTYGRSKLAGEQGIRAATSRHVILRTSWVYSPFGKNFVRTILRLAAERERLTVVADQRGCPTAACDIAKACFDIALRCAKEPERAPYGLYHFAGTGEATWFEFAGAIVDWQPAGFRASRWSCQSALSTIQRKRFARPTPDLIARPLPASLALRRGHGAKRSRRRSIAC